MNRLFKNSFLAITVLLMTGAVALPAAARSVTAYAGGRSFYEADAACFSVITGGVTNTCGSMKKYEISLPVDSPGYKTVLVNAYGTSASNDVSCQAIAVSSSLSWGGSPQLSLPSFGSTQTITLSGANVLYAGSLYLYCEVDPGGRINSVNFDY